MEVIFFIIIAAALMLFIFGLMSLSAAILMWAWNTLALATGWSFVLTFWPAFAIVVLLGFITNIFRATAVARG